MTNVCKNYFYYIHKTKAFFKAALVIVLLTVTSLAASVMQMNEVSLNELSGSVDTFTMFNTITILVFVAVSIGNEFKNKTIYYLVMNGHSRFEIFFGKLTALLPYIVILGILQNVIMYLLLITMTGRQFVTENIHNFLLNTIVYIMVFISYAILSLSFTFITKSTIGGIGGSMLIIVFYSVIYLILSYLPQFSISSHTLNEMFGMFIFRHLLSNNTGVGFPVASLMLYVLLSALYIIIGYNKFKKDDLI